MVASNAVLLTASIAELALTAGPGISDRSREISAQSIVDCLGVMIGGSVEEGPRIAANVAARESPTGPARIVGGSGTTGPAWAALVNGTAAHVLDFDDGHHVAMAHPSAVLLPALLAVAENERASGAAVIDAHAIGVRIFAAMGSAINPGHYMRGWHATSSVGTIAATAAIGALLQLSVDQVGHALGIAASQSSGIRRNFGSMTKSFHAGWAAHAAVIAARLAAGGFTSNARALEDAGGWLDLFASGEARDRILESLSNSSDEAALAMSIKRFAACGTTHTPLEAALDLSVAESIPVDSIESVECRVNPATFGILNSEPPTTGLEAKFNLEYCIAVALIDGAAGLPQFTDERARDPRVHALAQRVSVTPREPHPEHGGVDARKWAATVVVRLRSGDSFERTVERRRGLYSFRPLELQERRAKFVGCVEFVGVPTAEAGALFDRLDRLDEVGDLRGLELPVVSGALQP